MFKKYIHKKYKYDIKSDYEIQQTLVIFLLSGESNISMKKKTQMDMTRFYFFHRYAYFCE